MPSLPPRVQTTVSTPLGDMRLVASDLGLAGAWFVSGQRHSPPPQCIAAWPQAPDHPLLCAASDHLATYFRHGCLPNGLALDLTSGTSFQQAVWHALQAIAPGQTESYVGLARRLGRPTAVRAVGSAVGRNPLSLFVPCHRVVGANGALTGYAGGLDRKAALLQLECVPASPAAP
jgi:methylated-DNA-[protein]-cysteine S-methyltransferase